MEAKVRPAQEEIKERAKSAKSSLKILEQDDSLTLRGIFSEPLSFSLSEEKQAKDCMPRALRSLSKIITGDLCHRCGSCVGICPTGVLSVNEDDYPEVINLSACTDCNLCVQVCPGDEFNWQENYRKRYRREIDLRNTHGFFKRGILGYAKDLSLREASTSGGLVTAILEYMLDRGEINGALVTVSAKDPIWRGKPIIARSKEELRESVKSKYALTPTNILLSEIAKNEGKFAVVGLPCQIHGIVKAMQINPKLKEKIVLTIGLFCHAAIEHDAFKVLWETLGEVTKRAKRFISRVGKHPGTPHLELENGELYPVYFPNKKGYRPSSMELINIIYRLYTPPRCMTCFDALAEFADIAVGDPWMAPPKKDINFYDGWSFALVRSSRGEEVVKRAEQSGYIHIEKVTKREALKCNTLMAHEKRWRAFRVIETNQRQGKPIPRYLPITQKFPRRLGFKFIKTEIHILTHIFCYLPRYRAAIFKFILSDFGYYLLWLNKQRRKVRLFLRDKYERLRVALLGRE